MLPLLNTCLNTQTTPEPTMSISWFFEGLNPEPAGLMPLGNLNAKGSSSLKNVERVASYNWLTTSDKPTMVIPGCPRLYQNWTGGRIPADDGYMLYDVNHMNYEAAPLDPLIQAMRLTAKQNKKPEPDFQQYDYITDSINLQKIFAFCRSGLDGMFRIDMERVGKTVLLTRLEGQDIIPIEFETYDKNFRSKCSGMTCSESEGPFQQISSYTFGNLKILARYDVDCAEQDLDALRARPDFEELNASEASKPSPVEDCPGMDYVIYDGKVPEDKSRKCLISTTFPINKGFPSYVYPHMYFTGADALLTGMFKANGDFNRPASNTLGDLGKVIKPLPLPTIGKVNDCLTKLFGFMGKCEEDARVTILWRGQENIEIFERNDGGPCGITDATRNFLKSQIKS